MKYSEIALKILALKECNYIKTNIQFWLDFNEESSIDRIVEDNLNVKNKIEDLRFKFAQEDLAAYGMVCAFDDEFPQINSKVTKSEKPYLLFYRGYIDLLQDLNRNVAVIGLIDPDEEIEKREIEITKNLIDRGLNIVSGLANGCDTIAHSTCVENNAKTIAILPSTLNKIYPASNRALAEKIVQKGGLLLTEYFNEPNNRYEATSRYIERDRLQALFSKAVIMIASYRKGCGDSGSRHAMEYAEKCNITRYVMYNCEIDINNERFGLNKEYVNQRKAFVLSHSALESISQLKNQLLIKVPKVKVEQLKMF